jgi:predicted acylesterase/phospholipase RssA
MTTMNMNKIKNLIFSGGGSRGIAYAAVLQQLYRKTNFDFFSKQRQIETTIGASIGALFAVLVSCRYHPSELIEKTKQYNVEDVINIDVTNLFFKWGLDDGSKLKHWTDELIAAKTGKQKMTFLDLHSFSDMNTIIVVTNLQQNKSVSMNYQSHPNVVVSDAVAMSMALPPVFSPVKYKGEYYVDGGLLDNFPCASFNPLESLAFRVIWNNNCTLSGVDQYISRVIYVALATSERIQWDNLSDEWDSRTIAVDVGDISTINFRMSASLLESMMHAGENEVNLFCEKNDIIYFQKANMITRGTQTD